MLHNSVAEYRKHKGVSKSELARRVGVCASYITRLENNDIQPSGEVMFRFAAFFRCRIEEIFRPGTTNGGR